MARESLITVLRTTRASLNAQALGGNLNVGEIYFITDENRLAVGTGSISYQDFAKLSEAGGGASDPLSLSTETTADAAPGGAPATGVKLFAMSRANRRIPGYVGPTGRTERIQPFLGSNDVIIIDVPSGGTGYTSSGATMATDVGTATTPAITTTNVLTMQIRRVLSVAATANLMMEAKASAPWCSRRLVGGGFHFSMRFGLETVLPGTGRLFAGLTSATTAIASGEVLGVLANTVGLYKNSADTTLKIMLSAAAGTSQTVVLTNTGAVGWNIAGSVFQLEFFCAPGDAGFGYRVQRLQPNGASAPTLTVDNGYVSSGNMPGIDTLFVPHLWAQNVAATATSVAMIQMYKESD